MLSRTIMTKRGDSWCGSTNDATNTGDHPYKKSMQNKGLYTFGQTVTYAAMDGNSYPAVYLGPHRIPQEADHSIAIRYPDRVVIASCWNDSLLDSSGFQLESNSLLQKHGILITCFSYVLSGRIAYRFYFVDVNSRYLHNPMVTLDNGKKTFPIYYDHDEGMRDMISAAQQYIQQKP